MGVMTRLTFSDEDDDVVRHLDGELELVVELRHQQIVAQRLPHLHDPHHRRVDLILAVLKHSLRGAHLLLHLRTMTSHVT